MPSEKNDPLPDRVGLEERLAWLERHVTAQDKEMLALHDAFARLRREFSVLRAASASRAARPSLPCTPWPSTCSETSVISSEIVGLPISTLVFAVTLMPWPGCSDTL